MSTTYEYPREAFSRVEGIRDASPDVRERLLRILDTVFFASILAEEGALVPISVVLEGSERLEDVVDSNPPTDPLDRRSWFVYRIAPIPFDAKNLKKLAHGVEYGRDVAVLTLGDERLEITGIARRRRANDGGNVLRIAAPRPGVLVLEGRDGQLGIRYEAGVAHPNDVDVFDEAGPVFDALQSCSLADHRWMLYEAMRHARSTRAGAMFLCVPTEADVEKYRDMRYRFHDPTMLTHLADRQRRLFGRRLALATQEGGVRREEFEARAKAEHEWEMNEADLDAVVEMLGRLAANDGAVVVGPGGNFVGAGLIVGDLGEATPRPLPKLCFDASSAHRIDRPAGGGARHDAGLRFAWTVHGSVVFVVSSDGPVTCAIRHGEDLLTWPVRLSET